MTEKRRCIGTNANGERCRSTILVDGGDYCAAHVEGGLERMREIGRKGAETTNARWEEENLLRGDELPKLKSPRDAERFLEVLARAISLRRIGHREADVAVRAVRAWLAAHSDGALAERLEEMSETIAELKRDRGLKAV